MKTIFCVVLLAATSVAASVGAAEPVAPAPAVSASFADGWALRSTLPADATEEDRAAAGRKGAEAQRFTRWSEPAAVRGR